MKNLKNQTSYNFKLDKSDQTYELRRKVINILYEVKRKTSIPRIEVRIVTNGDHNVIGYAYFQANIIHINKAYMNNETKLVHTVLHELCHAVKGINHVKGCHLMDAYEPEKIDLELSWSLFMEYIK